MPKTKVSDEKFTEIVNGATTIMEILKGCGYTSSGTYRYIKSRIEELGLDFYTRNEFKTNKLNQNYSKPKHCLDDDIIKYAKELFSFRSLLIKLNLNPSSGSANGWIKRKVKSLEIDVSHFTGQNCNEGKTFPDANKTPLDELLIKQDSDGPYFQTYKLKHRLFKENVLHETCILCGLGSFWMGKQLALQMDHINGDNTDNRIENLRILCPNCHTQTDTYAGKNKKKTLMFNE